MRPDRPMGQTTAKTGEQIKEKLKGLKAQVVALQKQARELEEHAAQPARASAMRW